MKIFKNLKNKNKKYLIIGTVIAFILIGRSFLLRKPNDELTFTTTKETLVDNVVISGVYTTAAQTEVFSPSKGIIAELYVANGDEVQKGEPLFYIESTATDEEKALAYANYQGAINNLRVAKQNKESFDAIMWTKQKALLDAQNNLALMNDNLLDNSDNPATGDKYTDLEISSIQAAAEQAKKDFYAAEKQYKEADGGITAAQAAVSSNKLAYDATKSITVKAPASGKIVNLLQKVGDGVTNSTATQTTSPVLIIANLKNPSITAKVSEAYVSRLVENQAATIVFDAVKDQTFTGFIEAIDTVGTDTAGVVTYNARIAIEEITPNIKPNMTGIVTIETFRKDDVFSVPNSAIIFRDGKTYVSQAGQKKEKLIEVELGARGIAKTEIISGLTENLEILVNVASN